MGENNTPTALKGCGVKTRIINVTNINSFVEALQGRDWSPLYLSDDVNYAYNYFVSKYNEDFDKYCPIKKVKVKSNYTSKPWLSKGLLNACKKKNQLYKIYVKTKSKKMLDNYKRYKNKLTSITRVEEKKYYTVSLSKCTNNVKATWKILNNIITKKNSVNLFPDKFYENGVEITNKIDIANGFNKFFVNVGPTLAKNISDPSNGDILRSMSVCIQ